MMGAAKSAARAVFGCNARVVFEREQARQLTTFARGLTSMYPGQNRKSEP